MAEKIIVSPDTVVPDTVQVVVDEAVCFRVSAVVVTSAAEHAHPLFAVNPVAPFMVMTTVQVPVVPDANCPAVAPPTVVPAEHPEIVNLVPPERTPGVVSPDELTEVPNEVKVVPAA